MIQRKQTLFLLAALILTIVCLCLPVGSVEPKGMGISPVIYNLGIKGTDSAFTFGNCPMFILLLITCPIAIAAIFLLSRRLPLKTLRRSGIILDSSSSTPEKNSALALGDRGLVVAALRPAGKVKSHGVIYDAVSDGRYIEEGCEIEIAQIVGSVVQVREHSDT